VKLLNQQILRQKLLRSNPTKLSLLYIDDNDEDEIDDDGLITGYRRRDLTKLVTVDVDNDNDNLSGYVLNRLEQARATALAKYQEVWG
jgi:hypothetical protein